VNPLHSNNLNNKIVTVYKCKYKFCIHQTSYVVSACSQFRTEAVFTTYGLLDLVHVFASRQHALESPAGCDRGITEWRRTDYDIYYVLCVLHAYISFIIQTFAYLVSCVPVERTMGDMCLSYDGLGRPLGYYYFRKM